MEITLADRWQHAVQQARDWLWAAPRTQEPWWERHIRALLRIFLIFCREFEQDRLVLRASALTFTVILSLVPMLALGTAVLKGLGAGDQARHAAYRLIDQMESSAGPTLFDAVPHAPASPPNQAAGLPPTQGEERRTLGVHLRRAVDQVFDYVDRTDFSTLGTFGVVGLVLAVISVLSSIEHSMNAIWHVTASRPLGRKIMDYLAFIILMPLAINVTLAAETTLQSETLRNRLQLYLPVTGVAELLLSLLPLVLLVGTFALLYRFLPNTRVKTLPALVGGFFGGLVWLITQTVYLKLQLGVARYNAIYGSFATVPLFLLWVQFCWMIFLAGAEMAFAVQNWPDYRPRSRALTPISRLALAYGIIDLAAADLANRRMTEIAALAAQLGEPETVVLEIVGVLEKAGILRQLAEEEDHYVLAAAADTLNPAEVIDLVFGTEVVPLRGSALAIEALQAAREAVKNRKITAG